MNGDVPKRLVVAHGDVTPYALATYLFDGEERVGLVLGDRIVALDRAMSVWATQTGHEASGLPSAGSMLALLRRWDEVEPALGQIAAFLAEIAPAGTGTPAAPSPEIPFSSLAQVELLAPVPRPEKMLNLGLNFQEHADEMGMVIPAGFVPNVFFKGVGAAVIGPSQPIRRSSDYVDWEAELAVVIGRSARDVPEERALEHVAGYTCHNDVTDRRLLVRADGGVDFLAGKARDTFAPLGPFFVPGRFVPRPEELRVRLLVNGEVHQDYGVSGMYWPIARCVAHVSSLMTLQPGDVIGLGTGAGTGWAHGAPHPRSLAAVVAHMEAGGGRFLRPGDQVAVEIDGVGRLENAVL